MRMLMLAAMTVASANFLPFDARATTGLTQKSNIGGSVPVQQTKSVVSQEQVCQTKAEVLKVLEETRINVFKTVKGMPLAEAFDVLREKSCCRINFHLRQSEGETQAKQSFTASDISLMEALKLVCDANDYRFEIHDNIVLIWNVRGDRFKWVDPGKSTLARELAVIRIPETSFRPSATIVDAVSFFNRQINQNGGHGGFSVRMETGFAPPVLPTITLRDCTMLNALDLVCQSVGFTFRIKDRTIEVMTKTLAANDAKYEEMRQASTSRISRTKKKTFTDSNPWNAMRKTVLGLFPGWRISPSLRNRLPKTIPSMSKIGYVEREDWRADVLGTVGDGVLIETESPRQIRVGTKLRFWVMGRPGACIFVKSRNKILATRKLENSAWTEVVVSLADYNTEKIPLTLGVEESQGGDVNLLWSGIELK